MINRDENEQRRILQIFLQFVNQNEDPLSYWELVISDSFSETIENIFYVSFLLKEGVLVVFESEEWAYEIVVPDYDRIENKSKWSRKSAAANKIKKLKFVTKYFFLYLDLKIQIRGLQNYTRKCKEVYCRSYEAEGGISTKGRNQTYQV